MDALVATVGQSLKQGRSVTWTGFGVFERRERQERQGVNPRTKGRLYIPAQVTAGFRASPALKQAINS